jgi:hypothetical protein
MRADLLTHIYRRKGGGASPKPRATLDPARLGVPPTDQKARK